MKRLFIPLLLLIGACNNPVAQTNFDKVKAEHPAGRIFSEQPQVNGKDWVVREGDAIYNVEMDQNGVPKSTLLIERWNPAWDTATPKKDTVPADAPPLDSIKKLNNDSITHK